MKVKSCEVCGERFTYQKRSRKTCSDRCRKRLSRKKYESTVSIGSLDKIDTNVECSPFVTFEITENTMYLMMKRLLVLCDQKYVHVTELILLDRWVDILIKDSKMLDTYQSMYILIHKMMAIKDQRDEYGYIHFKTKKVANIIAQLKKLTHRM